MNPELHAEPETFKPERYFKHTAPAADHFNVANPYDRDHFTYGAGRRICSVVHVAERSLFINISRTLWGFNIAKKKGPDEKPVEPDRSMARGFLSVPKPFECDIFVRSPQHEKIIREAFAISEREGIKM